MIMNKIKIIVFFFKKKTYYSGTSQGKAGFSRHMRPSGRTVSTGQYADLPSHT